MSVEYGGVEQVVAVPYVERVIRLGGSDRVKAIRKERSHDVVKSLYAGFMPTPPSFKWFYILMAVGLVVLVGELIWIKVTLIHISANIHKLFTFH